MTSLYDTDYYAWAHEQATLLTERRLDALDVDHLAEELALMAESELGQLVNRLAVLLTHLLKLAVAVQQLPLDYQRAGRGWRQTCWAQRVRLAQLLRRNPSLYARLAGALADGFEIAQIEAAHALGVYTLPVPTVCPWKVDDVLNPDFWPEGTL